MSRSLTFSTVAVVLLALTAGLLAVPLDAGGRQARVDAVPAAFDGWTAAQGAPPGLLAPDGQAERNLVRTYVKGGETVWVSVAFYPVQFDGHRPVGRALLFPSSGWSELAERSVTFTCGVPVDANLIIIRTEGRRLVIAYWYQAGTHTVGSDYGYRAVLLWNRLVHRRSDGALVRVAAPIAEGTEPAMAATTLTRFVCQFHPELVRHLPD